MIKSKCCRGSASVELVDSFLPEGEFTVMSLLSAFGADGVDISICTVTSRTKEFFVNGVINRSKKLGYTVYYQRATDWKEKLTLMNESIIRKKVNVKNSMTNRNKVNVKTPITKWDRSGLKGIPGETVFVKGV